MEPILANCSVSISELKNNPVSVIERSCGEPVAVFSDNKPIAYMIPAKTYDAMIETMEDDRLGTIVREREADEYSAMEVNIDEL